MLHLSRNELGVNMSLVNHWVFLEQVAEGMGRARGLALPVGGSVLGGMRKHLSLPGHCGGATFHDRHGDMVGGRFDFPGGSSAATDIRVATGDRLGHPEDFPGCSPALAEIGRPTSG